MFKIIFMEKLFLCSVRNTNILLLTNVLTNGNLSLDMQRVSDELTPYLIVII